MKRKLTALCLTLLIICTLVFPAYAYQAGTLRYGMRGEEVRELQEALIELGFLKGTADGIFGTNTENAVRKFQKKNKLTSDGLAGAKTRELIQKRLDEKRGTKTGKDTDSTKPAKDKDTSSSKDTTSGSSLFGGNYTTLRLGSSGSRVKILQNALITLKYLSGKADGKFGNKTRNSVIAFQKKKKLTADGIAGKKTLTALEKAVASATTKTEKPTETTTDKDQTAEEADEGSKSVSAPKKSSIQLLSWYDQVKPSLSNKQKLLIYDPSTGLSWTLSILSRGRHCDAEPLTKKDTQTMVKAFGGKNTWTQKGVYVRLPDGRWTIGSTHDMPHESGSIKDNGFNGHLCVHFLRTMEETTKNDPNYGVSNQKTIRALWKSLTGQEITD